MGFWVLIGSWVLIMSSVLLGCWFLPGPWVLLFRYARTVIRNRFSHINLRIYIKVSLINICILSFFPPKNPSSCKRKGNFSRLYFILPYLWPVWLNGWVLVCELSDCWFESRCCHLLAHSFTFIMINRTWHQGQNLMRNMCNTLLRGGKVFWK